MPELLLGSLVAIPVLDSVQSMVALMSRIRHRMFADGSKGSSKEGTRPGKGHPVMFGLPEAQMYDDFPEGGGYPKRFLIKAYEIMGVTDPSVVLHVCSGSMKTGVTVDIRPEKNPTVIADARHLPFANASFRWILADPPYSADHAENLYMTGSVYPSPHVVAQECIRILKPGGFFGFMHPMVPRVKRPGRLLKVYTITQGMGYNVRAWSLFTKD